MVHHKSPAQLILLPAAIAIGPHVDSVVALLNALRSVAARARAVPIDTVSVEIALIDPPATKKTSLSQKRSEARVTHAASN